MVRLKMVMKHFQKNYGSHGTVSTFSNETLNTSKLSLEFILNGFFTNESLLTQSVYYCWRLLSNDTHHFEVVDLLDRFI